MADTTGIQISVDLAHLQQELQNALDYTNKFIDNAQVHKLKVDIDANTLQTAIKNVKAELENITKNITPKKIELGVSRADGQVTLAELEAFNKAKEQASKSNGLKLLQSEFNKTTESIQRAVKALENFKAELTKANNPNTPTNVQSAANTSLKPTVSVSTKDLVGSIKSAITEINSGDKLASKPIKLTASMAKLRDSVSKAITEINKAGSLSKKPIKINAVLDTSNIAKQLQQLNIGTKTGGTGYIGQLLKSPNDVSAVTDQLKQENAELSKNNRLLKERLTNYLRTGDEVKQIKYGSKYDYFINTSVNGQKEITSHIINQQGKEKELERITAAATRLQTELDNVRAKYDDVNVAKPIKNTDNLDKLKAKYGEITAEIDKMKIKSTEYSTAEIARIKSLIAELNRLKNHYANEEYSANALRDKGLDTSKVIQGHELDAFVASINKSRVPLKNMKSDIANLKTLLANVTDKNSLTTFLDNFDIAKSKFVALRGELETTASLTGKLTNALSQISKIKANTTLFKNSSSNEVKTLYADLDKLQTKITTILTNLGKADTPEKIAKITTETAKLTSELNTAAKSATALKNKFNQTTMFDNFAAKIQTLSGKIAEYVRINERAMSRTNPLTGNTFGTDFNNLAKAVPTSADMAALNKYTQQFNTFTGTVKQLGLEGNTVFGELLAKGKKFIQWFGVTRLIMNAITYISKLFSTVATLDESLIDLRKTFKGGASDLEDFYFQANKIAKKLGTSTDKIIQMGSAFSRLGYSSKEAVEKMSEMTAMFAAISPDMNTEQAQNGLVSIMKAFNIDPENVLDEILSKVNAVGNTAATSNGEIVTMLEKSSAAMAAANNSLEQTVALGTAGIEVLRDAAKIGVSLKSISMNIRALDEETGELIGDTEEVFGKIADYTKTASNPNGVSIFTDKTHKIYRSTYDILKDIAAVWNEIEDSSQAALTSTLGGKYQGNAVAAILQNFEAAEKAMETMKNSAGSAEAEMNIIRQSVSFALNEMKAQFEDLAQNSVTRDFLKDAINTGTGALKVITALVKTFGALPTVIGVAAGSIAAFSKKTKGLFGLTQSGKLTVAGVDTSNGFKAWYREKTDTTGALSPIRQQIDAVKAFDNAIKTGQMDLQTYNAVMKSSNNEVKRYGRSVMQGTDNTKAYRKIHKQLNSELRQTNKKLKETNTNARLAGAGAKAAAFGVRLLNAAASMFIGIGISWIISSLLKAIDNAIHKTENLNSELKELSEKKLSINQELETLNSQLATTKEKIEKLESLPELSLLKREELDELKKYNDELERQRKQRENEARKTEIASHKKAKELAKEIFSDTVMGEAFSEGTSFTLYKTQLEQFKKLKEELAEMNLAEDKDEVAINKKEQEIEKLENTLLDFAEQWENIKNNLKPTTDLEEKQLGYVNTLLDLWDSLQNKKIGNYSEPCYCSN